MPHFLLTLLLLGQATTKPQTDQDRLAALQLSEACRADGDRYWQREGYPQLHQAGITFTYLTHYNRERGKCFIQITTSKNDKDQKTLSFMIFDAVEGSFIADKTTVLESHGYKPIGMMLDSTQLAPTADNLAKFDALMQR
jgi:hypothetical protein